MNSDTKLSLWTAKCLTFNLFSVSEEESDHHDCLQKSIYDLKKTFSEYLNNLKTVCAREKWQKCIKNKNFRQIENAKMMDCRAVKWKRDALKKIDAYQTVNSALKKIMKEKIKDEILKK